MPTEPTWKHYLTDYNEGLGLVYERFVLNDFLLYLKGQYGFQSVLEAPLFGMAGVSGINSVWLARVKCPITLVDDNPERLAGVEHIWGELGLPASFTLVDDWARLPFEDNSFDFAWDWAALWWLKDPAALLRELVRCSRKLIFVAVPNPVQVGYQFRKYVAEPEFVKEIDEKWTDIGMIRRQTRGAGRRDPGAGRARCAALARHGDARQRIAGPARHPLEEAPGPLPGRRLAVVDHGLLPGPPARPLRPGREIHVAGAPGDPVAGQASVGAPSLGVGAESVEMTSGGAREQKKGRKGERERGGSGLPRFASHPVTQSPSHRFLTSPWLQIALIVAVAAFFRLWQIGSIPPGLFGDEATDGLDALDVLAGRGAIFFPANFGREGLHMWLVAGMFRLMGVTPLALRLPSALAGIATTLATYWLGRELVGTLVGRETGRLGRGGKSFQLTNLPIYQSTIPLLAALYVATSYWHVHFSRFGIRGVFTPLFGALAFAAFWRAVNRANQQISKSANLASRQIGRSANGEFQIAETNSQFAIRNTQYVWFALSGLFLGLATHFYTASRFYPFFLGGFLILQAIIAYATGRREQAILRRNFWGIVVLFVVAALIFAPLGLYFVQHPGSFMQRASEVAATKAANPWLRMGQAAAANVLQFFVPGQGDPEQFYNLPRRAVFDPLTALLALIGIGVLLWRWRQPAALFLLAWFPALLLPSFLATDRWPTLPACWE